MALTSPEVARLISASPAVLPLMQTALRPAPDACKFQSHDAAALFPGAQHRQAALAGLLFRFGCWDESHVVAQDLSSAEGSYWHGMLHRIEPDSSNARYWFRRVGQHPIFPELLRRAGEILNEIRPKELGPKEWRLNKTWDPFLFIDWCDEARERGGEAEAATTQIQMAEWELLFNWCAESGA